jgi:hypothetical protein
LFFNSDSRVHALKGGFKIEFKLELFNIDSKCSLTT